MIEKGLGIGLMTSMILKRTPYRIVTRPLSVPAFRQIAFIVRDNKRWSIAVKRFAEYVEEYRCRIEE
jgi:DNA-binding transcriptional LysR family regulator